MPNQRLIERWPSKPSTAANGYELWSESRCFGRVCSPPKPPRAAWAWTDVARKSRQSGVKSRKSSRNCIMSRRIHRKPDLRRRLSGVRIRQSTIRPCIVSVLEIHENDAKMDNASFPINSALAW